MCIGILNYLLRDVVEAEEVAVLSAGDDADVITKQVLLKELLGEVLQVALGHLDLAGDGEDVVLLGEGNVLAQDADLAVDLDLVAEELLLLNGRKERKKKDIVLR